MNNVGIVIFAKAPVPGFAKTRLIPALGEEGAAALAKQLLQHTINEAQNAHIGPVELCVTPDQPHPVWQTLEWSDTVKFSEQDDDRAPSIPGEQRYAPGQITHPAFYRHLTPTG